MQVTLRAKSNLVRVINNAIDVSSILAKMETGKSYSYKEMLGLIGGPSSSAEYAMQDIVASGRVEQTATGYRKNNSKSNDKTWPKYYTCNFLEQGAVSYEDVKQGKALLRKETIDAMLNSFIGKPVIVDHRDVSPDNYKKVAVGYVTDAYFNAQTGWFDCAFILTDDKAKELVDQGYSVSCSFDVLETKEGGDWHAIQYDEEISKGEFQHLALVTSPRYEDCRITMVNDAARQGARRMMFNSKETKIIKEEGMSKKNGIDIMSPLQRDKYFESLSDSGVQALIDDPDEDKEIKKLAEAHQGMRKQQKEEELLGQGQRPGAGKDKKNSMIEAKEAFVKIGEEEISVEALIERNNALATENAKLKAAKDNTKACEKCNVCHEGECKPEDVAKKNEIVGAKPGEGNPKADNEFPPDKEKEEEDGKIKADNTKKNSQHFVKLNALKESAEVITSTMVDTLFGKIERGNSRYGSK